MSLCPCRIRDPGQWAVKQTVGELSHRRALPGSAALDAVGSPEGVGTQFGGVVLWIGGAAAPGLAGMDLDQLAPVEDAHQFHTQADLHLLSRRAQGGRHRVEGVLAGHGVVGMHLGGTPVGDLVGLAVPREQGLALLVQEDLQGLTLRGAVNAHSGDITAPADRFRTEVGQIPELGSLEEAFPGVLDAAFYPGLVLGVSHPGRIGDEAPVLRVFQEAPGQAGMQGISAGHRCGEVVDDQVFGNAAEEFPGRLQAVDHVLQLLAVGGPQEAVPGVGQHHQQRPHRTPAAGLLILDVAQAAEVQLRHFSRPALLHPNGSEAAPTPVPPLQETPQRRVGHGTAPLSQQFLDTSHLEAVDGDPLVDLITPGFQLFLDGRHCLSGTRPAQAQQPIQLFPGGIRAFPFDPCLLRRCQVLPDRIS